MKIEITTPAGAKYIIHDNGNIQRRDGQNVPHSDWRMLGIKHVTKREFVPLERMATMLGKTICYKNGNPMWTVRDLDHGTVREWGNTKYHGIKTLNFIA